MKRVQIFCVAAVLLTTGTVSADLIVHEYVPGQKVTLDTLTGNYWYWNMADFVNRTYDAQISAISALGTYGNIAGGWHMANLAEMQSLWNNYSGSDIVSTFASTGKPNVVVGRYDSSPMTGYHYYTYAENGGLYPLQTNMLPDSTIDWHTGAWVTTDAAVVVPAPPAAILAATGLLSSLLGVNRWRRKR